ncbi:MAG: ABC transporter ATP-binding protein [Candidatus Longimicrobiales bacterium M2_2A_002]
MTQPVIELFSVTKNYGDFTAVRDLSLAIPRGATYGLLGPNGAGKTTTIRMILRIIEETTGEIRILGDPVSREVLDRVGYLPEERGIYKRMTVGRLLTFLAELKGVASSESAPRIDRWLERLELLEWKESKVENLSKGMQQKLQFIATILHEPELVILDEPFSGLDPINQRVLREIITELRDEGRTILFSTHIIEHAERICDHVCIIARGRKVADGTLQAVKRTHGDRYVSLDVAHGDAGSALRSSRLVESSREDGPDRYAAHLAGGADPNELLTELVRGGIALRRFELVEPTLEQVFIETVGEAADEAAMESAEEVALA